MSKFRILPILAILAVLLLAGAGLVWAQGSNATPSPEQPGTPMAGSMMGQHGSMMGAEGTMGDHDAMQAQHQAMIEQMQAMNAKLDSLVETMNQAEGDQKVDAMAAVVNELVAQRTAMSQTMGCMQPGMTDDARHADGRHARRRRFDAPRRDAGRLHARRHDARRLDAWLDDGKHGGRSGSDRSPRDPLTRTGPAAGRRPAAGP